MLIFWGVVCFETSLKVERKEIQGRWGRERGGGGEWGKKVNRVDVVVDSQTSEKNGNEKGMCTKVGGGGCGGVEVEGCGGSGVVGSARRQKKKKKKPKFLSFFSFLFFSLLKASAS